VTATEFCWEHQHQGGWQRGEWYPLTPCNEMYLECTRLNRWERVTVRYDNGQICTFKRATGANQ
jgi:hypothetical protein